MSRGVKHQGDAETSDSDRSSSSGSFFPKRTFRKNAAYKDWQYAGHRKSEKIEDAIRTALLETPEVDYTAIVTTRGGIWNFFRYKQKHQEYTNDRKGYTSWVNDMAKCARNFPELEQRLRKSLMSVFDNLVPEGFVGWQPFRLHCGSLSYGTCPLAASAAVIRRAQVERSVAEAGSL